MSNYELDARVVVSKQGHEADELVGTVTEVKKGWHTVLLDAGNTVKLQAKHLSPWVESQEADDDQADDKPKGMSGTLNKYRRTYRPSLTAKGGKSQSSTASITARYMEGYDHAQVAQVLALLLGMGEAQTEESLVYYRMYAHLNNGQMRMNCGNRINNAVKRGDLTEDDVKELMESLPAIWTAEDLDPKHRPHAVVA
ncbi:hypothetical protein CJY_0046 [Vibrio phage CJY]|nr:hypothetical protein CJY_0046 [Vibrio phage CJY]